LLGLCSPSLPYPILPLKLDPFSRSLWCSHDISTCHNQTPSLRLAAVNNESVYCGACPVQTCNLGRLLVTRTTTVTSHTVWQTQSSLWKPSWVSLRLREERSLNPRPRLPEHVAPTVQVAAVQLAHDLK
jgi:hypothetical protein